MLSQQFLRYRPFYLRVKVVVKIKCDLIFRFGPCASFWRSRRMRTPRFSKLIVRRYLRGNGPVRSPDSDCSLRYRVPKKGPKWPFWPILGLCRLKKSSLDKYFLMKLAVKQGLIMMKLPSDPLVVGSKPRCVRTARLVKKCENGSFPLSTASDELCNPYTTQLSYGVCVIERCVMV